MNCPALDVITRWVGDDLQAVNCTVPGEQIQLGGFEYPNPKIVCGIINIHKGATQTPPET
jgi:hypothetical protein